MIKFLSCLTISCVNIKYGQTHENKINCFKLPNLSCLQWDDRPFSSHHEDCDGMIKADRKGTIVPSRLSRWDDQGRLQRDAGDGTIVPFRPIATIARDTRDGTIIAFRPIAMTTPFRPIATIARDGNSRDGTKRDHCEGRLRWNDSPFLYHRDDRPFLSHRDDREGCRQS